MLNQFSRTQLLIGKEAMDRLSKTRVAIFGIKLPLFADGRYLCIVYIVITVFVKQNPKFIDMER